MEKALAGRALPRDFLGSLPPAPQQGKALFQHVLCTGWGMGSDANAWFPTLEPRAAAWPITLAPNTWHLPAPHPQHLCPSSPASWSGLASDAQKSSESPGRSSPRSAVPRRRSKHITGQAGSVPGEGVSPNPFPEHQRDGGWRATPRSLRFVQHLT